MEVEHTATKIVCNAVFKGGGAKGIAYAGALKACEKHIAWSAVAGSSAGAITATMVACKISPTEVEQMMPTALKTIGNPYAALLRPGRASLLDSTRLHDWLRRTISHAILGDTTPVRECTFKEILDETGISLYVVTLDLATRQPIVFGPDPQLTPASHVAPAVVASSAIPVAFPAARMVVDDHVHRVVDGGTWSNYPAFVFLDDEFRRSAGLDPTKLPTIGFVLDEKGDHPHAPESSPTEVPRPSLIGDKGSSAEAFGIFGAVVSSTLFRWAVGLMPVLFVLLSVYWLGQELRSATSIIEQWVPREFQDLAVVSSVAILAVTGLAAVGITILILRLGKTLFDSGLVGASAAMGVGPSVAYWVGTANRDANADDAGTARPATNHIAVRIQLDDELKTLSFGAKLDVRQRALDAGRQAAATELHRAFGVGKTDEGDEHDEPVDDGESKKKAATWRNVWRVAWPPFGLVVALAAGTTSSFEVVNGVAAGAIGRTSFWMAVAGVSVTLSVRLR